MQSDRPQLLEGDRILWGVHEGEVLSVSGSIAHVHLLGSDRRVWAAIADLQLVLGHQEYNPSAPELETEIPNLQEIQPLVLGQIKEPSGWLEWYYITKPNGKIYPYRRYCYRIGGEKRVHHVPHRRVDVVNRAIALKLPVAKILKILREPKNPWI